MNPHPLGWGFKESLKSPLIKACPVREELFNGRVRSFDSPMESDTRPQRSHRTVSRRASEGLCNEIAFRRRFGLKVHGFGGQASLRFTKSIRGHSLCSKTCNDNLINTIYNILIYIAICGEFCHKNWR